MKKNIDPTSFDAPFLFCIIGEKNRLRILRLLMNSPINVERIKENLKIEATLLSKHLKVLRMCGMVLATRKGRSVIYEVNPKILRDEERQSIILHCCEIKLKNIGKLN